MNVRPTPSDRAAIWQTDGLHGLIALHARYDRQRFPRHVHEEFVIGVNEAGAHAFYCRHGVHPVPPGSIALVNPGDVHTGEPLGNAEWNYRGFYPTEGLLRELWEEATGRFLSAPFAFDRPVVADDDLAAALIRANATSSAGNDPLHATSELVEALTALAIRYGGPQRRSVVAEEATERSARLAREYIHAHVFDSVTLQALADAAGAGRFAVLRAFRRAYGMAPYEYVITLRIVHARRLLRAGTPAAAVALQCGFADQSHLHRHFRRIVGVTPGAYARAVRAVSAERR